MANEDKTKRVIKDAKKQNEQGRIKKTRQFSIPRTYVPRSVALILPSYHFGGKASEGGVDSEISHTEYVNTPQDLAYSPIETKGNQIVHPEPAPYIAGGDYEPPHHTENTGSHHFTQPHHYGKPVTSTPTNTFGQTNLTPIPTINSHTVEHKDYSYLTPPVVGLPQPGTVVEDTTLAVSGTVDIHSAQKGAPLTFTPDNLHGQYGEFTLNKDTGEWSYALDNSHHQNLAQGETHTEILHVTATSAAGVSVHQDITVTVQGTNDIPVITSQAQHESTKEDGVLFVNGQVSASDVDHGAVLTYTPDNLQGQYGLFSLNPSTGKWAYTLNNQGDQALAEGEHHTETMLVTVTDEHGATTTQTVTVDVEGTNDRPVITSQPQAGTVKEDDVLAVKGQVTATDVDHGSSLTYTPDNLQGQYGSFSLSSSSGRWIYKLNNNAHQALALGESHTENMLVTVTDERGAKTTQQVTVTVEGTNDKPVITSQAQTGAVKEDDVLFVRGQVTATDIDHGAVLTYTPDSLQGHYGSFTLNSGAGTWTYKLDNNGHQDLALGEHHTDVMLVTVTDEHGAKATQEVRVEVTGTNDKPVITSGVQSETVKEDATLFVRGQVVATDVDNHAVLTYTPDNLQGQYGSFTLNKSSGSWAYKLDNAAHQALAEGEHHTETLLVTVTDEHGAKTTQQVTVEVEGTNDRPVIASQAQTGAVKEDATLFVRGQVTATDVDKGAVLTYTPDSLQGQYGSFTLNKNSGTWTYTLDNSAHQELVEGQYHTETLLVTVTDEHGAKTTQTVTVDVEGTNDRPVITSSVQHESVKEDATLFVRGQVTASDVDNHAVLTYTPDSLTGQYGAFTLNKSSGAWTYKLDNSAHQALVEGEHHTETLLVTVTDEHGAKTTQTVTVDVEGTNDKPVITSKAQAETVKEDDVLTATGQITASDVDHGAVLTYSAPQTEMTGAYGSFTLNPSSGVWHYKLDNTAHQALAFGETHTETLHVTVTDDKGATTTQSVVVTVEGTNDKPVITSSAQSGSVNEDGTMFTKGQVSASDVDNGAILTYTPDNLQGHYGSFSLNPSSGTWTYTLDNQHHQDLAEGEKHTETLLVTVTDEHGAKTTQQVTVDVTGTNDRPVITSNPQSAGVKEDDVLLARGQVTATDVDKGSVLTYTPDSLQGQYGSFTLNKSSGTWTYTLDNQHHQDLAEGEHHTETMLVTVTDEHGARVTQQVSIDIEGTNDRPKITSHAQTGSVTEDKVLDASGQVIATDVDHGAKLSYTPDSLQGNYGVFTLDKTTGAWHYSLDKAASQVLGDGEHYQEHMLVTVTDEHGAKVTQQVSVDVQGTNDAPVITSHPQAETVKEDDVLFVRGQVTATDSDQHATLQYSATNNLHGQYGTFTLNPSSGGWTYTLDNANQRVQALAHDETHTETLHVLVTDNNGATTTQDIEVTVKGTNDRPVISLHGSDADSGSVIEEGSTAAGQPITGSATTTGHLTGTDVDSGDTQSWSIINPIGGHAAGDGVYGHLTVNANGQWTYALDNSRTETQALTQGQQVSETFTVRVTDSQGLTAEHQVTVNVTGSNDQAHITGQDSATLTEDTGFNTKDQLHTSGDLAVTDVDSNEDHFKAETINGQYGSLTVDTHGHWHYEANNNQRAIQELKASDSLTDTITVQSADGTTHDVAITINGTNDLPVIANTGDKGNVVEAGSHPDGHRHPSAETGTPSVFGTLSAQETDKGDPAHWAVTNGQGTYGWLVINARTGRWEYTLDNTQNGPADRLHQGEVVTEHFEVTYTDSSGTPVKHTVEITVTGSNDVPVISGTHTGAVTEAGGTANAVAGTPFIAGDLSATDYDNNDGTLTWSVDGATSGTETRVGKFGTFTIDQNGHWHYQLNNSDPDAQKLQQGQNPTETFTVLVTDSSGKPVEQEVTVTVHGTNDDPVLAAYVPQTFAEDSSSHINNHRQFVQLPALTDVDDTHHTFSLERGHPGWVSIDQNGQVRVKTDAGALQHLSVGEHLDQDVVVIVEDDHGGTTKQTLHLTIQGTNDTPRLSVLKIEDRPGHFSHQQSMQSTGNNAHQPQLSVNEDSQIAGKVFFNDVDDHKDSNHPQGDTYTFTTQVKVTDEHGHTTTVSARDAGLTLGNDGHFTFDASAQIYQHLQIGQNAKVDVLVTVTDNHGAHDQQHVHFTVHGQNDAPTVTQVNPMHVDEDHHLKFTLGSSHPSWGQPLVDIQDIESDKLDIYNPTVDPKYGRLVDHGMGRFEFIPAKDQNFDTFGLVPIKFEIDDNHGARVTREGQIRVDPVNDAPVAHVVNLPDIDEDSGSIHITQAELLAHTSDIDNVKGDLAVTSLTLSDRTAGILSGDAQHGWTFTPAKNWNSHKAGHALRFNFVVNDGSGGQDNNHANLHIRPVQDIAVITDAKNPPHTQDKSVTDGTGDSLKAEGYLQVVDPDLNEDHFKVVSSIPVSHGFASIDRDGHWVYSLNPKDPTVLALGQGETLTDHFVVHSADGTAHTVDILVTGKNEAPVVTKLDTIIARESNTSSLNDPQVLIHGQLHVHDSDANDKLTFTLDHAVDGLTLDPTTGGYTFDPSNPAYNHLRQGEKQSIPAQVTISDGHGGVTHTVLAIEITGTNDAPKANAVPLPTTFENQPVTFTDSQLLSGATDPDTGDHLSIAKLTAGTNAHPQALSDVKLHDPSVGFLTQDGKGGYVFTPRAGYTGSIQIDYSVTDGIEETRASTSLDVRAIPHISVPSIINGGHTTTNTQTNPPQKPVDTFTQSEYQASIKEDGQPSVSGIVKETHSGSGGGHTQVHGHNHMVGNYGYLQVTTDGLWTYRLNNHQSPTDLINQLAVGETAEEVFTLTSDHGYTKVKVTITGSNDKPTITGESSSVYDHSNQLVPNAKPGVAEVDTLELHGDFTVTDVDHGDHLTFSEGKVTGIPSEFLDSSGHLAGLTVNPDGTYVFAPDSSNYGSIPPGQSRTFTVPVVVTDKGGLTDTTNLVLTVEGHNRPPVVAHHDVQLQGQKEDFGTHTVSAHYLLTLAGATDPDGDPLHVTHLTITGANGAPVTVRDDGHGNFIFSSIQNQHGDLHFSFEVTDGMPHSQAQTVTATLPVSAVNDNPVAADFKLGSVAESTTATPTPTHVFTEAQFLAHVKDPDIATDQDVLHLTGTPTLVTGDQAKGRFEVSGNVYRFVPTDPNFHGTVHVTYEVTDSSGAKATAQAAIVVTPTNDPAVITNPKPDFVEEDGKATASGQLGITDVDGSNQEHFHANSHIGGQFGYLQLDRDGNWNYVLTRSDKPGVQQLSAIGKLTEHFHITSQDGTKYDLSVEVRGTNDDPVLNAITAINGKEGGNTLSGQIHATDVDTQGSRTIDNPADVLIYETQYTHAGFSLNSATGAYSLDLKDPIFEHLAQGEKETLTVPVTVTDNNGGSSHTRNLVITVTGTNDVPVLDAITQITKNEDDAVVTGQLSAHDVDSDNLQGQHTTYHLQGSQVAGFTLNPDGSYSFDPHAYNALKVGEHKDITIPIIARDNHGDSAPQNLVIHLTGTNDAPIITGTSTATVTDGPSISATTTTAEQLHITDPDSGESHFIQELNVVPDSTSANPGFQQSAYGHLSITADGKWQYHVDTPDAIKAIPHGETVTETFTVHSADGAQHTVAVTLQGSNEAATIGGTIAGVVTEDSSANTTGKLTVTDVDRGEEHFQATTAAGTYGTLDVDRNGEWTYTLNNANQNVQRLGAGVQVTDTIKVQSADGTSQDITVSITGTNDAPTVFHALTKTLNEDSSLNLRPVMFGFTDTDQGDTLHSISLTSIPDPATEGQLLLNGNPVTSGQTIAKNQISHLVFNPVTNFNGDVHFGYKVSDGHADSAEQTATLHVTPVNDPAQISMAVSALVREDSPTGKTAGSLSISDPDGSSEEVFKAATGLHGQYGELDIDEHGHWGYTMTKQSDAAIQGLKEGETLIDKVTVYSQDGTAYEVEVQISGENDSPTVTPVQGMTEQAGQTHVFSSADFGFKDIDGDALHHITVTSLPDPAVGVLELDDGHGGVSAVTANAPILSSDLDHLRFVPAQGVQGGQLVAFDYTANDGHVDSVPATLSMMLENPAPAPQPSSLSSADEADTNIIENAVVTLDDLATEQPEQTGAQAYLAHLGIVQHNHDGPHSLDTPADLDLIFASSEVIRDEHGVDSSTIMGDDSPDLEHETHDDFNHHHDLLVEHHY
ncbi:VCBS domain-containing protein [Vibrio breoganii]|uniref:VCBS domain-containing protein n=1 Tax=Vibrio breoganii TaxID=553239 RepID=UPI0021C2B442|nr:VCBS domain-containing protein [Vibrio breoganii]MDN3717395.1 VCBS domain-containing protein [Vibrio breoganii]